MQPIPIRHLTTDYPTSPGGFSIRKVESLMGSGGIAESLHRHDFFFVLVLSKGSGVHEIDFTPYDITANSIFLMRPGQVHRLVLQAGSEGYLMQFDGGFFYGQSPAAKDLLRKMAHLKLCRVAGETFEKLTATLADIHCEFSAKRENFEEIIRSGLTIFFISLMRNRRVDRPASTPGNAYAQEMIEKFSDLLEDHIRESKQVSFYADKLNLSAYQVNGMTKSLLGKTASEVIAGHIVLEAKRQLLATSAQITQIAYHLGYDDPSYFIRFFKKQTGQSPESFRQASK